MIDWLLSLALALSPAPARPGQVEVSARQEADGTHTLAHEVVVDAPIAEVWPVISTPEGWQSWAVPVARFVEGEPDVMETSYTSGARPGDPSTIRQHFVARLPGRILVFRTVRAPERFPDFDTYRAVTGIFELEPVSDRRTRIRLTSVGYADSEAGRRLLGYFREGNRVSLERLRRRFAEGPVDWSAVLRQAR